MLLLIVIAENMTAVQPVSSNNVLNGYNKNEKVTCIKIHYSFWFIYLKAYFYIKILSIASFTILFIMINVTSINVSVILLMNFSFSLYRRYLMDLVFDMR